MKVLMYFATAVLGLLGALSILRFVERVATGTEGAGSPVVQLGIGAVFILLASKSLGRARA